MTSYITDYNVSFKITNRFLLGALKGDFKVSVEKETGTAISIDNNDVTITGSSYEAGRTAESKICDQLKGNSLVIFLSRNMGSYLIGTGGERIQHIQQKSKAYVQVSNIDRFTSKLEILGNPQQFRIAKEAIIGKINEKIQEQMNDAADQGPLCSLPS